MPTARPYVIYQNFFTWFNARVERSVYGRAKAVVAVSRRTGREVQDLGIDADKIHVIYNGVDTDVFHRGKGDRGHFGLPEQGSCGLFVGDIRTPRKNLETILRAMPDLPSLSLAIAGDPAGSPYPALARELGIADRVFFLGKTSEVALLMRSVDMFVFPSRYEAHPLVLMEALASGLPVIASAFIAQGEDFVDACLLLPDPNDGKALAKQITHLLESPALREKLSGIALAQAQQMNWAVTTRKYLNLYEALARSS